MVDAKQYEMLSHDEIRLNFLKLTRQNLPLDYSSVVKKKNNDIIVNHLELFLSCPLYLTLLGRILFPLPIGGKSWAEQIK